MSNPIYVVACYPWSGTQENQLSLEAGKLYQVLLQTENGWARGNDMAGNEGFFPSSFVKPCSPEEVKQILGTVKQNQVAQVEQRSSGGISLDKPAQQEPVQAQPEKVAEQQEPVQAQPEKKLKSSEPTSTKRADEEGRKKRKKSKTVSTGTTHEKSKRRRTKKSDSGKIPTLARKGTAHTLIQFEQKSSMKNY